jgi:hypothetical protein
MHIAPKCCFIPCTGEAEWEIWDEQERDPYVANTQACTAHVGELLGPSAAYRVVPLPPANLSSTSPS